MGSFEAMRRRLVAMLTFESLLVSSAWPKGHGTPQPRTGAETNIENGDVQGPLWRQPIHARTVAETAAGITPQDYSFTASPADVRRHGAVLDGDTDDTGALIAAIAVAAARPYTIVIEGPMALKSSVSIPSNITIVFIMNGALLVAQGKTVNIGGLVNASPTHVFQGPGTTEFTVNKQRSFFAEWWGAKGDSITDDSTALVAALAQVSNAQGTLQLVGAYLHTSVLVIPPNTEIVGYGKNFGTKLIPAGAGGILFNSDSIRCALRRCVVELGGCSNRSGIEFMGGAYNCVIEDVFVHGLNNLPGNSFGIAIGPTKNTVLNRVSIYGQGAGPPLTGILVDSGTFGVLLVAPNIESCFYGIHVTGSAQCDIVTPYLERCSGYSIYLSRKGTGGCTIRGGDIQLANSRTIGVGIAPNSSNISIYDTRFTLNGGRGIASGGKGTVNNVSIYGVDAANIDDPDNHFQIYGIGGTFIGSLATGGTSKPAVTGSWTRNGRSVTLSIAGQTCLSNAPGMTVTGLPRLAQPLSAHTAYCNVIDHGIATPGEVSAVGEILIFYNGQSRTAGSFASAGTKGFREFSITYTLD